MELKNKTAIVTGGANGIGRSLVEKLVREGVKVGVFDINQVALENLKKNLSVETWVCDVSNNTEVEKCINQFIVKFKTIDILVNNAGIADNFPLINVMSMKKHDIKIWDKIIATTLSSVFYMSVNVAEKMIKNRTKGVIVNISSVCADGNAGQTAYSAAKAGVDALTKTWAKELNNFGIRVAGIAPGFTKTDVLKQMSEKVIENWNKQIPIKRMAEPEEIADGIMFILKNDYFNGKILQLDGGLVL